MAAFPDALLCQRLRNRVIEVLELAVSPEHVAQFGLYGTINWMCDFIPPPTECRGISFSNEEIAAVLLVEHALDRVRTVTPKDLFTKDEIACIPEWEALVAEAKGALDIFDKRGRMSEDQVERGL